MHYAKTCRKSPKGAPHDDVSYGSFGLLLGTALSSLSGLNDLTSGATMNLTLKSDARALQGVMYHITIAP
ncbi:hypothetical protein SAMN05216202_5021 [Pseudomonas mucidolens]|uniref:Uncharacterized protein n=1 Tax=Pseudomonas mucidolens TaxID=46679 RepID=A0A1H2P035_9PSED|nr:hypothetical protein SAMN05216202_5021 [Pseudomonas mucidolens]SQH37065.1 Uncharacterised protein [Pseudomonas mucidolens]